MPGLGGLGCKCISALLAWSHATQGSKHNELRNVWSSAAGNRAVQCTGRKRVCQGIAAKFREKLVFLPVPVGPDYRANKARINAYHLQWQRAHREQSTPVGAKGDPSRRTAHNRENWRCPLPSSVPRSDNRSIVQSEQLFSSVFASWLPFVPMPLSQ